MTKKNTLTTTNVTTDKAELSDVIRKLNRQFSKASSIWMRPANPDCYFSDDDVLRIILHDVRKHNISTERKVIEDTCFSYLLYLRVYAHMLNHYSIFALKAWRRQVLEDGLLDVISALKDCSDEIIIHQDLSRVLPRTKMVAAQLIADIHGSCVPEAERVILQLLRFGKRFVVANDFTSECAYNELLRCNEKCKTSQWEMRNANTTTCYRSSAFRQDLLKRIACRLEKTFADYGNAPEIDNVYKQILSKNAVRDACTCDGCKAIVFLRERGFQRYNYHELGLLGINPSPLLPNTMVLGREVYYPSTRVVEIHCVPKTATTGRCISPEEVVAVSDQTHIRNSMERGWWSLQHGENRNGLRSGVNYYDQTVNQNMAMLGSIHGELATLDLHSASDLIHLGFVDLLPRRLRNDILQTRPTHFLIQGKRYKSYITAFMGCGFTYSLMSAVLEAIVLEAEELVKAWTDIEPLAYSVVGDDIICDTRIAETLIDLLGMLGLEPNREKSFYDPTSNFRESCGGDYWKGSFLTTCYWPRKLLTLGREVVRYDRFGSSETQTVDTLISLQHAISQFSLESAEMLGSIITSIWPEVTEDAYGGVRQSVWSCAPRTTLRTVPHVDRSLDISSFTLVHMTRDERVRAWMNGLPYVREHHSTSRVDRVPLPGVITNHAKKCKLQTNVYMLTDNYLYMQYLEHGPLYEDALSELLHISTRRCREDLFYTSRYKRI